VDVKGKGTMQTYWIEPKLAATQTISTSANSDHWSEHTELEEKLVSYLSKHEKGKPSAFEVLAELESRVEL